MKYTMSDFALEYLKFKEQCIERSIINIDEIIKLFEVWICSSECLS